MSTNQREPMSLARFTELVDTYGSEPQRWPEAERDAALLLLTSDARATALQRAAAELDNQLAVFEVPGASSQLTARVLEIPIRHQPAARRRFSVPGWAIAAFALVPCVLGFATATMSSPEPDDTWDEVASLTLLGDVPDEEWP